ncbi:MAG: baeRF3 domain-containing protein [Armatimonadota bacterium]
METLHAEEVRTLAGQQQPPCISIYMPTDRRTTASAGNGTRFKNMLRQAEQQLAEQGLKERAINDLLSPAKHLLEDRLFWEYQSDGFACFISPDVFRYYRLPLPFQEFAIANRRFHLKPMLELLSVDGHFFVLALSKKHTRFLYCTRYGSRRIEVRNMPPSLEYTLRFDERSKDAEFQDSEFVSRGRPSSQTQITMVGMGGEKDRSLNDLIRFFHEIDDALQPLLRTEEAPLVMASVGYEHGVYRDINHYAYVAEDYIQGNPELLRDDHLRERGWQIAEPIFLQKRERAVGILQEALGHRQGSTDVRETVRAAQDGVIDFLFVPVGMAVWGRYDAATRDVEVHEERQPGDEDLLDLAALSVLATGGMVWALQPDEMPEQTKLAATLRYPIAHPVV